jgi:urease accessory protein
MRSWRPLLVESGGDNLASTFSLDLVDYWLFVIDVADGDDIPRKRGPGIVNCDLLLINKVDLAPYVGADVAGMERDSLAVRRGKPVLLTNCRSGEGIDAVIDRIAHDVLFVT